MHSYHCQSKDTPTNDTSLTPPSFNKQKNLRNHYLFPSVPKAAQMTYHHHHQCIHTPTVPEDPRTRAVFPFQKTSPFANTSSSAGGKKIIFVLIPSFVLVQDPHTMAPCPMSCHASEPPPRLSLRRYLHSIPTVGNFKNTSAS